MHALPATPLIIVVPALLLTLLLSSLSRSCWPRFSWRLNVALLILFTAGNLLPQQVLHHPAVPAATGGPAAGLDERLRDAATTRYWGLILIHVAFQIGFCTFVLTQLHEDAAARS